MASVALERFRIRSHASHWGLESVTGFMLRFLYSNSINPILWRKKIWNRWSNVETRSESDQRLAESRRIQYIMTGSQKNIISVSMLWAVSSKACDTFAPSSGGTCFAKVFITSRRIDSRLSSSAKGTFESKISSMQLPEIFISSQSFGFSHFSVVCFSEN